MTSFQHITGFQKRALRTFTLVIWLCEKVWLKMKKTKKNQKTLRVVKVKKKQKNRDLYVTLFMGKWPLAEI